jgi:hypothetical protein
MMTMNEEEVRQYLIDKSNKDLAELAKLLSEHQQKTGIPPRTFIVMLKTLAHEMELNLIAIQGEVDGSNN